LFSVPVLARLEEGAGVDEVNVDLRNPLIKLIIEDSSEK
jgi:hypothetical protein